MIMDLDLMKILNNSHVDAEQKIAVVIQLEKDQDGE